MRVKERLGGEAEDAISVFFFFFKQKTAYEIGTGDWSSDVCSSDLFVGSGSDKRYLILFRFNNVITRQVTSYTWRNQVDRKSVV